MWEQITSFENMLSAFHQAAKGKRSKKCVADFELNLEQELFGLIEALESGQYMPGKYTQFSIRSPKQRLISAAPFRDRVVHHALCNIIEPIFERRFIFDSYANRKGKGTHRALDRCTSYMRKYTYVLPLDIVQFFPSIDHTILLNALDRVISCEKTLTLCALIMRSGAALGGEGQALGLPIGNLTSQFWANVYLNPLDHFIKRALKCRGYIRYVDDMLLFSDDKSQLLAWKHALIAYLAQLKLRLHVNSAQARPCRDGLPFLGFQVFPDHRRLKRRKAVQARRHLKSLAGKYHAGSASYETLEAAIQSWIGHVQHGDTWGLRSAILREIVL